MANNIDEEESVKKLDQLKKEAKDSHKNRNQVSYTYIDMETFHSNNLNTKSRNKMHQFKMEKKKENPLYTYRPLSFYTHGPSVPPVQELIQEYVLK